MRMIVAFLLLASTLCFAQEVTLQKAFTLPHPWVQMAAPADAKVPVMIVLAPLRETALDEVALDVSNPDSAAFGKHLTVSQLADLVANPAALAAVRAWLDSNRVPYEVGSTRDVLHLRATAAETARLFKTQVFRAANNETKQTTFQTGDLTVPVAVAAHIRTVLGVHGLPLPPRKNLRTPVGSTPYAVTPSVIEDTYKVSGVTPTRGSKMRQAVAEFQGQYMNARDLSTFFQKYVKNSQAGDDTVYKFVGKDVSGQGVEALLDIEYLMGVGVGEKTEFWEFPSYAFCSDLVKFTQAVLNETNPPRVFSVSYGWQGDTSRIGCSKADVQVVDSELAKLATQGITMLFSSGDSGSGMTGSGSNEVLYPSWPASSPWVTAVGATRFINQMPANGEMATDQFGSGGGFSSMFPAPTYQRAAIASYFANEPASGLPPASTYTRNGRGTPDVSALGEGYQVVEGGRTVSVGGTSASAPAFGGMIALINDARAQAGKGPIGFLNQWLYKGAGSLFTDVVVGSNRFGRGPYHVKHGWDCVAGWDPATGLGTPKFDKMLASALAAP